MKKVAVVLSFLVCTSFGFTLLQSCNKDREEPCRTTYTYAQLISATAELKHISGIDTGNDMKEYLIINDDYSNKRFDSIAIQINHELKYAFNNLSSPFFFSFSHAMACTPSLTGLDQIKSVVITSSEDYNAALPKGANLGKVMHIHSYDYIDGYRAKGYIASQSFQGDYNYANKEYLYTFTTAPSENKTHNLTFKYILRDGREVSTTINNVLIKK